MSGLDLTFAQTQLDKLLAAETALIGSQSYTIEIDGSRRSLTRADGKWIAERIAYYRREIGRLSNPSRRRMRSIVN